MFSQNGSATSDYVARIRTRIFNLGGSQKGRHVCFNVDSTKNKDIINVDKTIMNTHDYCLSSVHKTEGGYVSFQIPLKKDIINVNKPEFSSFFPQSLYLVTPAFLTPVACLTPCINIVNSQHEEERRERRIMRF